MIRRSSVNHSPIFGVEPDTYRLTLKLGFDAFETGMRIVNQDACL